MGSRKETLVIEQLQAAARALGWRLDRDERAGSGPFYVLVDAEGCPKSIGSLEAIALNPDIRKEIDHGRSGESAAVLAADS
jgi:hypothetical protein